MARPIVAVVLLSAALTSGALRAQEPRTEAGAYAAAVAAVRARRDTPDSARFAPDSAAMYRQFVTCRAAGEKAPVCSLVDDKPVVMVLVHLSDATSGTAQVRYYYMLRGRCPVGPQYDVPIIGYTRSETFSLRFTAGRWQASADGKGIEC